jgi:tetratricopeptide (TPR) repeat protein
MAGASGRTQRALVLLTTALDHAQQLDDPARAALLHMRMGAQHWVAGNEKACLTALDEAVRILPPEPSAERARVLAAHAQWLMQAWHHRDAIQRAEEALEVARTVDARTEEGLALDILGSCTNDVELLVAARQIAEEVGNAEGITQAYLHLSAVLWSRGRLREANDCGRRGLAVARELGLERSTGSLLAVSVAGDLCDLGDLDESDRIIAAALEHQTPDAVRLHAIKGCVEIIRGDFAAAAEHLELTRQLSPSPFEGIWPYVGLAVLASFEGRYDDARSIVDEAVGSIERLGFSDSGLFSPDSVEIYVVGLWAEADCAELARVERSEADLDEPVDGPAGCPPASGRSPSRRNEQPMMAGCPASPRPPRRSCRGWRVGRTRSCGQQRRSGGSSSRWCVCASTPASDRPRPCSPPRRRGHGSSR